MADVCYSELTCFEQDKGKFEDLGFRLHERLGNGCVQMYDDQADHGHCQELQGLAGEGVVFHGHSGAGADYPPVVFASDGSAYATCETIVSDGLPALEMAEDGELQGQETAERYWRVLRSARARCSGKPASSI